jgi:hypothetical protein
MIFIMPQRGDGGATSFADRYGVGDGDVSRGIGRWLKPQGQGGVQGQEGRRG